jgi:hypothetical protein
MSLELAVAFAGLGAAVGMVVAVVGAGDLTGGASEAKKEPRSVCGDQGSLRTAGWVQDKHSA